MEVFRKKPTLEVWGVSLLPKNYSVTLLNKHGPIGKFSQSARLDGQRYPVSLIRNGLHENLLGF